MWCWRPSSGWRGFDTAGPRGDWRLGRRKFAKKLEYTLNAGMSADQVLRDAEAEFVRVNNELYVVARQLWHRYFPTTPLPVADVAGRRETVAKVISAVSKEHGKPEEIVADTRALVDRIKTFIRDKNILRLPMGPLSDHRDAGVSTRELGHVCSMARRRWIRMRRACMRCRRRRRIGMRSARRFCWRNTNRHMLQILTIHEAYPGHYVQLEYSSRTSLLRRVLQSGVMIEGWAITPSR